LFGNFGREPTRLGWTANDLFALPHNGKEGSLVWLIKGSPLVAVGKTVAFTQDGRAYQRNGQP
jgi:hypothetical protein